MCEVDSISLTVTREAVRAAAAAVCVCVCVRASERVPMHVCPCACARACVRWRLCQWQICRRIQRHIQVRPMIQGVLTIHAIEANDVVLLDGQPPETVLGCYLAFSTRSFMKRTRAIRSLAARTSR